MFQKRDWSFDNESFYDLPEIIKDLHDNEQYYIPIIDVRIKYNI